MAVTQTRITACREALASAAIASVLDGRSGPPGAAEELMGTAVAQVPGAVTGECVARIQRELVDGDSSGRVVGPGAGDGPEELRLNYESRAVTRWAASVIHAFMMPPGGAYPTTLRAASRSPRRKISSASSRFLRAMSSWVKVTP